ncbi:unnamed protein product [Ectocarpus sp. 12 AP-2014]
MTYFDAAVWDLARDQYGRRCWADKKNGRVTYQLEDRNGIPLWPHGGMNCPVPCTMGTVPVVGQSTGTVVIVGGKCKEDKWSEYTDGNGKKYYHNPFKNETTWDKPKDFDEENNEGKPAPPADPEKKEEKKPKYIVKRGWWP